MSKKSIKKTILLLLISLTLSGCSKNNISEVVTIQTIESKTFYQRLITTPLALQSSFVIGVVPHHEIPKEWIGEFWSTVAVYEPETIILLSPNHFKENEATLLTSVASWKTPIGELKPNNELIIELSKIGVIQSTEIMVKDHGFTTHIPYINQVVPNAKIVPILVSNRLADYDLDQFTKKLKEILSTNKKTVIVGSIDFSHYLDNRTAAKNDRETKELIEDRRINQIQNLTNDHVDARAVLAVIVRLSELIECRQPTFLHHGNSADFIGQKNNTTSYYVFGYQSHNCVL